MIRGIFTGLFFGGVLGLMLAAIVSLVSPLPATVETPQAEEPETTQPVAQTSESPVLDSETDAPVNADSVAQAPEAGSGADGAPVADVTSAPKPQTATVSDAQSAPQENGALDVTVQGETPVLPNPQATAIAGPAPEEEPSISVDPAQPQSPVAVETNAFGAPSDDESPKAPATTADAAPSQTTPTVVADGSAAANSDQAPTVDAEPAVAPAETAEVEAEAVEAEEDEQVSMLKPATGFDQSFEQRTSTRLPTVGAAPETVTETTDVSVEETMAEELPPLEAYAAAFERDGDKPLMSIVLLDDAASGVEIQTLADFPLPVSIAVDAQTDWATARAAAWREAGLEVIAIANFPLGATASDVEVNLSGQLEIIPEAVALMDGFEGGVQETREIADQVISYALDSGHGLILQPKGLNTAQKLAVREGVGAVTVFRDFDGKGQTEVVMRRFLDQAAFKARQNESVLMMGRLQEKTIAALASWALQDRASTVSVAPVSALLMSVK